MENTPEVNYREGWVEPEALVGLGVNWTFYTPTGGWGWNYDYRTRIRLEAEKVIKDISASKEDLVRRNASVGKVVKTLDSIREEVAFVSEFFENYASLDSRTKVSDLSSLLEGSDVNEWRWIAQVNDVVKRLKKKAAVHADPSSASEVSDDYVYMKAVKDFLDIDMEVDALLYGLFDVKAKYRTKVFRVLWRRLKEGLSSRDILQNSKSAMRTMVNGLLEQRLGQIFKVYDVVAENVRKMKRELDRRGPSFWDEMDMDEILAPVEKNAFLINAKL